MKRIDKEDSNGVINTSNQKALSNLINGSLLLNGKPIDNETFNDFITSKNTKAFPPDTFWSTAAMFVKSKNPTMDSKKNTSDKEKILFVRKMLKELNELKYPPHYIEMRGDEINVYWSSARNFLFLDWSSFLNIYQEIVEYSRNIKTLKCVPCTDELLETHYSSWRSADIYSEEHQRIITSSESSFFENNTFNYSGDFRIDFLGIIDAIYMEEYDCLSDYYGASNSTYEGLIKDFEYDLGLLINQK